MVKEDKIEYVATGRRKTAVASVRMRPGSGKVDVNARAFEEYFPIEFQRKTILAPLQKLGVEKRYDLVVRVNGGGIEAQATAIRLGISRALVSENEEVKQDLKGEGFLTRDPRKRERKKYGLKGARRRFQFSKR